MKKSASGAPVTRIRPSAPTPRWRSQIAAMSAASSETRSSTSAMRTKSFPVPLYFAILSSSILEVLHEFAGERAGPPFVCVEPSDPRVAPEPRELPPGEVARPCGDPGGRLAEREASRHVLDGLSVPDGLARGRGERAGSQQPPGLVE